MDGQRAGALVPLDIAFRAFQRFDQLQERSLFWLAARIDKPAKPIVVKACRSPLGHGGDAEILRASCRWGDSHQRVRILVEEGAGAL